jgi:hypothetical protein
MNFPRNREVQLTSGGMTHSGCTSQPPLWMYVTASSIVHYLER